MAEKKNSGNLKYTLEGQFFVRPNWKREFNIEKELQYVKKEIRIVNE